MFERRLHIGDLDTVRAWMESSQYRRESRLSSSLTTVARPSKRDGLNRS